MAKETKSLFQQLLEDNKKALEGQNSTLIESSLKRRLMGTRDASLGNIDAHKQNINNEVAKLGGMNLEAIIDLKQDIADEEGVVAATEEIYTELFGVEMPSTI